MTSKSGGHTVRNRGRRGYGKAFDASRPNSSEKTAEKFAVIYSQNSVVGAGRCKEDDKSAYNISFKPTSNGGCGGQKDLQERKVADKLALLDDSCSKSRKRTRVS